VKAQITLLIQTVREAMRHYTTDSAAAIAFWMFFSVFPLLLGILGVTGYLAESEELKAIIFNSLTELLPGSADLVKNNVEAVMQRRGALTWVGIIGLLWSAGKVFGSITRSVNRAIDSGKKRSFIERAIRPFMMSLAVSTVSIVTIAIMITLETSVFGRLQIGAIVIPSLVGKAAAFVVISFVFSLIYKLAPYGKAGWRLVWPGALLAAVLFEVSKAGFGLYLTEVARYETVYGPLTSIIVLMMWLFVSAWILLLGAEYNIARWRRSTGVAQTNATGAPATGDASHRGP